MGVSTEKRRLTIGCYHPHPHKNNIKHPHVNPQTRRTFVTTLMNVSLCLLAVFVVSFTVFGTTPLANAGLHTKVCIPSTRIQTLHKPSLLICMDIHPNPGPFTVNNLPSWIRKLYHQVRRINSRIVHCRHISIQSNSLLEKLTLFRLGYFEPYRLGGVPPLFLLYLLSNYH